jgi:hypothetical protein
MSLTYPSDRLAGGARIQRDLCGGWWPLPREPTDSLDGGKELHSQMITDEPAGSDYGSPSLGSAHFQIRRTARPFAAARLRFGIARCRTSGGDKERIPMRRRTFVGAAFAGLGSAATARPVKARAGGIPMRTLGKTGVKLTCIGMGGARFHLISMEEGLAVLPRGPRVGTPHIVTPADYGRHKASIGQCQELILAIAAMVSTSSTVPAATRAETPSVPWVPHCVEAQPGNPLRALLR